MQNTQSSSSLTGPEDIAALNDELRHGLVVKSSGEVFLTSGMVALCGSLTSHTGWQRQAELLRIVRDFDAFSEDNDPHSERDFGSFNFGEVKCFWKIDYYDLNREFGSENPADPAVTCRVLTIMRADEY